MQKLPKPHIPPSIEKQCWKAVSYIIKSKKLTYDNLASYLNKTPDITVHIVQLIQQYQHIFFNPSNNKLICSAGNYIYVESIKDAIKQETEITSNILKQQEFILKKGGF